MGLAERVAAGAGAALERARGDFVNDDDRYSTVESALLGRNTDSSEIVDADRALRQTAVFAAIQLRADTVGGLPLVTVAVDGKRRREAKGTDAHRLLLHEPNPDMTAVELLSRVEAHLSGFGEAILAKDMVGSRVDALWPVDPEKVLGITREKGRRVYKIAGVGGMVKTYDAAYMIHIRRFALSGLRGMSPIALHRETIGGAIALDRYGNRVFRNGPVLRGVVSMKGKLSSQAKREFNRDWRAMTTRTRQHGVPVLDEDAQFTPVHVPLHDMEYVELKRLAVAEIARIFMVPASMIGGGGDSSLTYRTVEGDVEGWLKFGLQGPSLTRITQALMRDRDLFPDPYKLRCGFDANELLRASTLKRYQAYAVGIKQGFLTVDEVREDDGRDPLPGTAGDTPTPDPAPDPAPEATDA